MASAAREAAVKAAALALFAVACGARPSTVPAVPPPAPALPQAPPPPAPPPPALDAPSDVIALPVTGFRDAELSVPRGSTTRRPVVIALHGNYDRPEWQCQVWREITAGYPFVLCPRGIPRSDAPKLEDRWTYGTRAALEREIDAGLAAVRARFPDFVADGPVVFTGFSLGAILGRFIVQAHPDRYPRAVFIEGGNTGWSSWTAKKFHKEGGVRVLFACGQVACVAPSTRSARALDSARVVHGAFVGHTYDGPVAQAIHDAWPWLVEGDERYPANIPSTPSTSASSRAGSEPIAPR